MKIIQLLLAGLLFCTSVFAQKTYRINKSSGTLQLDNVNSVEIESYDGSEIVLTAENDPVGEDERADGLRTLNSRGKDNTGLGLIVKDIDNQTTEVKRLDPLNAKKIFIKLPKNVKISIKNKGLNYGNGDGTILIKNLSTEINAVVQYDNIKLENITGPSNISNLYGNIEATLDDKIKGPLSLVTVYGFVDISIPAQSKTDLNLSTTYGSLLASEKLNIDIIHQEADTTRKINQRNIVINRTNKRSTDGVEKVVVNLDSALASSGVPAATLPPNFNVDINETISAALENLPISFGSPFGENKIVGKLNGGGEHIILKSTYGKIYLRDKK
ncbi:DUF4097 family beta strand repeat-containing protein [Sphingobacterium hungaricum]